MLSSSAPALLVDDAGDGRVEEGGRSICEGEGDPELPAFSKGAKVADDGSGIFDGDSRVSLGLSTADDGSTWDSERPELPTRSVLTACGEDSINGSNVHSQCRLFRFLRLSLIRFKRFGILSTVLRQSLMAAA